MSIQKNLFKTFFTYQPQGQVLITVVLFAVVLSFAVIVSFAAPILRVEQTTGNLKFSRQSYFASESLAEDIAYRLKNAKHTQNGESLTVGGASASVSITSGLSEEDIVSTGNDANLERVVKISVKQGTGVAFNYGIETGVGGFILTGGAKVNGNVYANGPIIADSGVQITGSAVSANSPASTTDQSNDTPSIPPNSIIFGNANASQDLAQRFQVSSTGTLNKIELYIKKTGTPGDLMIRITTDNAGSPASNTIAAGTLSAALVTGNYGWIVATFNTNIQLTAGVTYWLVADGSSNMNKYYTVGANSAYTQGPAKVGQYGGAWNATSPAGLDSYFRVWLGGINGSITQSGSVYVGAVIIGQAGVGDAWAHLVTGAQVAGNLYCQTGNTNNKPCDTSKGDPTPQPMPVSEGNITEWKAEASAGGTIVGDDTVGSAGATLGPKEITGNLKINGGGTLTVSGTLWVHGTLTISGGANVKLASSYGANGGVIVTDGQVSVQGQSTLSGSGTAGSYLMIITTSDCPFDSLCLDTSAVDLSGGTDSVILIAQNGEMTVNGGTTIQEATAYRITTSGGATLNYSAGLANMIFTSGPSGGYQISSWQEQSP